MTEGGTPTPPGSSAAWNGGEDLVSRFESAWQGGQRPAVDDYLLTGDLRLLVELVHVDLERRLKAGEAVRAESYLTRYPDLARDPQTAVELIAAEFALRRQREP